MARMRPHNCMLEPRVRGAHSRTPKPELLRVLLEHLPAPARNGARKHAPNGTTGAHAAGAPANGSSGDKAPYAQARPAPRLVARRPTREARRAAPVQPERATVPCYHVSLNGCELTWPRGPCAQALQCLADLDGGGPLADYLAPRHVLDLVLDFAGSRPPLDQARARPACRTIVVQGAQGVCGAADRGAEKRTMLAAGRALAGWA